MSDTREGLKLVVVFQKPTCTSHLPFSIDRRQVRETNDRCVGHAGKDGKTCAPMASISVESKLVRPRGHLPKRLRLDQESHRRLAEISVLHYLITVPEKTSRSPTCSGAGDLPEKAFVNFPDGLHGDVSFDASSDTNIGYSPLGFVPDVRRQIWARRAPRDICSGILSHPVNRTFWGLVEALRRSLHRQCRRVGTEQPCPHDGYRPFDPRHGVPSTPSGSSLSVHALERGPEPVEGQKVGSLREQWADV